MQLNSIYAVAAGTREFVVAIRIARSGPGWTLGGHTLVFSLDMNDSVLEHSPTLVIGISEPSGRTLFRLRAVPLKEELLAQPSFICSALDE